MQCTSANRGRQSGFGDRLVQLLAGKVEERGGQKREHENAEKIAGRQRSHHFGAESEKVGAPGKSQKRRNPMRHAIEDLRVLEKINDDAEQAENATGGDQPAGIERPGAGLAFRSEERRVGKGWRWW